MHCWGIWCTGTAGNWVCRRCARLIKPGFLGDRVVDDNQRDAHVDGEGRVAPVGRAVVAANRQVDLVLADKMEEGGDRAGANGDPGDGPVGRTDQLDERLAKQRRSPGHLPGHLQRRLAADIVNAVIAFPRDRVAQVQPGPPRVGNADARQLIPQVVAAQDDDALLLRSSPASGGRRAWPASWAGCRGGRNRWVRG